MSDKEEKEKKEKSLKQKKLDYMIEMEKQEKEKDNSKDSDQEQEPETKEPKEEWRKDTVWENQQKEAEGSGELDEDTAEEEGKDIYGGNYSAGQEADREPVSHDNVVGIRDKEDRLTPKQEAFVRQVLAGDDLSTAYRKAYDAEKMSPASINREAHRLSSNPKITPRLRRGMEVREVSVQSSYHSLRHSVIERLDQMADDTDASDSARVRSLEMLGKHVGLFTDQVSITTDRTTEELQEELTTRIAELLELDQDSG
tara:strand:- start:79 stop:846 length:768 start_codon:yes stop_codon:yes gene_type:complete